MRRAREGLARSLKQDGHHCGHDQQDRNTGERKAPLRAAASGRQRPLGHQPAPREELVRGNAMSASHQAYRHARLECLLDDANLLRRCPAPTALNRCDDLNSIRRIGHRHGCMPHTCQVGDRVRSVRGLSHPPEVETKPRPLIDVASGSLPKSPVSLSPGDEVPKPRLQLEKFAINGAKRLLQLNLPEAVVKFSSLILRFAFCSGFAQGTSATTHFAGRKSGHKRVYKCVL